MKNVLIFLLILVCAALAWYVFTRPQRKPDVIEKTTTKYVQLEVERLNQSKDEKGVQTTIMEETDHILTQAGAKNATDSAGIIDSLQRLADGRLISYTQARAEIKRLSEIMEETDTSFTYRDRWLTVDVTKPIGGKPALLNSTYDMELNWMWYDERKRFLGIPWDTRTYGRFWPADPNATIKGLKHIRIEPPADNFGFSLQAIGDYYRGSARIGAGATVRVGRFNLQGAYLNNGSDGWHPAFRGSYNLIEW